VVVQRRTSRNARFDPQTTVDQISRIGDMKVLGHALAVLRPAMAGVVPPGDAVGDEGDGRVGPQQRGDGAGDGADIIERLARRGILGGVPVSRLSPGLGLDDLILIASTEINTDEDRDALAQSLDALINGAA